MLGPLVARGESHLRHEAASKRWTTAGWLDSPASGPVTTITFDLIRPEKQPASAQWFDQLR